MIRLPVVAALPASKSVSGCPFPAQLEKTALHIAQRQQSTYGNLVILAMTVCLYPHLAGWKEASGKKKLAEALTACICFLQALRTVTMDVQSFDDL